MSEIAYPNLVVLHDRKHGDVEQLRQNLGFEAPFHLYSATDLIDRDNPYHESLGDAASHADVLLVQENLARPLTNAAYRAFGSALFSSARRTLFGIFDNEYQITKLSTDDVFSLQREVGTKELSL